ncbi:MAG: spirocyclase AveC family protein [Actinomycetota bacterium]
MATVARTRPAPTAAIEPRAGKVRPVLWWAAVGALFLVFQVYLFSAWILRGDAQRVPVGETPVPDFMRISLSIQQWGLAAIALFLIYRFVLRDWRRHRRLGFDGLLILSFGTMWWSDPLYNYYQHGFNYNSYFINFGSWIPNVPGWQSQHGELLPQPIIWLPAVYICAFLLMATISCAIMRKAAARWPSFNRLQLFAFAFVPMVVVGTFWEAMFMRMGSHHYGSSISSITLFSGKYYAFPVYQGIAASLLYTSWGALRFFRDDKGRSVAEKGLDGLRVSTPVRGWLRFLSVSGMVTTIFFVFYHFPMMHFALVGHAWPEDVQKRSYFTTGLCGAGTTYACPGPDVPLPRRNTSLHVDPDGRLVVPDTLPDSRRSVPALPAD